MAEMTGGQALIRSIYNEGVRVIFGLPGVQLYHAMDALYDMPDIRFITTRHEQATTYMADGYARAGGQVGTAMVVPGPRAPERGGGAGERICVLLAGAADLGADKQEEHWPGCGNTARGQ